MVQDNTRELEDLSEGRLKGRARPCASAPVADTASASGSALMRVRFLTVPESNSTRGALAYGLLITLGGQRLFLPEHTPPHCQGELDASTPAGLCGLSSPERDGHGAFFHGERPGHHSPSPFGTKKPKDLRLVLITIPWEGDRKELGNLRLYFDQEKNHASGGSRVAQSLRLCLQLSS